MHAKDKWLSNKWLLNPYAPALQAAREPLPVEAPPASPPDAPQGHVHRQRDFGIGYGNSSGYGSLVHFTDGHVDAPFRFR